MILVLTTTVIPKPPLTFMNLQDKQLFQPGLALKNPLKNHFKKIPKPPPKQNIQKLPKKTP